MPMIAFTSYKPEYEFKTENNSEKNFKRNESLSYILRYDGEKWNLSNYIKTGFKYYLVV